LFALQQVEKQVSMQLSDQERRSWNVSEFTAAVQVDVEHNSRGDSAMKDFCLFLTDHKLSKGELDV